MCYETWVKLKTIISIIFERRKQKRDRGRDFWRMEGLPKFYGPFGKVPLFWLRQLGVGIYSMS
jgi:hypothetical protein